MKQEIKVGQDIDIWLFILFMCCNAQSKNKQAPQQICAQAYDLFWKAKTQYKLAISHSEADSVPIRSPSFRKCG